jgi:hypothetical protein
MSPERRQYYANKVRCIFLLSPQPGSTETLEYLDSISWPSLKSLELEVDLQEYSAPFINMLHDGLEHVDLSGNQNGGSKYFTETILPMIFVSISFHMTCKKKINKPRAVAKTSGAYALVPTQLRTMTLYMLALFTNIWMHPLLSARSK